MKYTVEISCSEIKHLDIALCVKFKIRLAKHLAYSASGFKYEVFSNEHPPPHFRVSKGDDGAVFDLRNGKFLHGSGKTRKIKRCVKKNYPSIRRTLIEKWNETRPADCPVGRVSM